LSGDTVVHLAADALAGKPTSGKLETYRFANSATGQRPVPPARICMGTSSNKTGKMRQLLDRDVNTK